MRCRARVGLVSLLAFSSLLAVISPAGADITYVETEGTSTGQGRARIIVESFGLGTSQTLRTSLLPSPDTVRVTVPSGSTAQATSVMIRDSVNFVLSPGYIASILVGHPRFVRIERPAGGFSLTVIEDIPGQNVFHNPSGPQSGPVSLPTSGSWTIVALAPFLLVAGAWWILRGGRRRNVES